MVGNINEGGRQVGNGLVSGYERRSFDAGPATYNDAGFMQKIVNATGLADYNGSAVVVDAMSGPGKVGRGIQELVSGPHRFVYLDLSVAQLKKIPREAAWGRVGGDVRELPLADGSADVVVARYGLKDLPADQQPGVLREIGRSLRSGGRLVIADMVSPDTPGAQEWLNGHHALKQQLGGRNPKTEGVCHIPTYTEWINLLAAAGFQEVGAGTHVSEVTTTDWVKGKQITDGQREIMDANILGAPPGVKAAFHVRQEQDGAVKIDYPVRIFKSRKLV